MARSTSPLAVALAKADAEFRPQMAEVYADDNEITRPISAGLIARLIRQSDPTIRLCLDRTDEQHIQVDDEMDVPKRDGSR